MTDGVRAVSRNFASLGAGEALARIIAFTGSIYLARQLGPAMFGIVGVVMGVMLYLTKISEMGVELVGVAAVARARAASPANAESEIAALAAPLLAVRVLLATLLSLAVAIVGLTIDAQPEGALLAVAGLTAVLTAASTRWIHLGYERTDWIALSRIAAELATLALLLVLVRDIGDVGAVFLAQFAGAALGAIVLAWSLRARGLSIPLRLDWPAARPTFERSRHLVLYALLGLVLFNFDLIFVRISAGAAAAGHYAAAYMLISFAANLVVAYAHTVMPALTRLESDGPARTALYQSAMARGFAVALPVAVGGQLIAHQILGDVFGRQYLPGVIALQWLIWSVPVAAVREIALVSLIVAGKEADLLRLNVASVVLNVTLVVALVPRFGLAGAAVATLATEAVRMVLAVHRAGLAGFEAPSLRRYWRPAVAAALLAAVMLLVSPRTIFISIPLGVIAYATGLIAVGALRLPGLRTPELRV